MGVGTSRSKSTSATTNSINLPWIIRTFRNLNGFGSSDTGNRTTGVTALMIAVWNNHTEIIKFLLQRKAKIKVYNIVKYGHLLKPSATRNIDETTALLIADRKEFQGQSLINAILDDELYTIELLIKQGASVNVVDRRRGMAPLHCAALLGNLDIVNILLDAGAELDVSCGVYQASATDSKVVSDEDAWGAILRIHRPDRQQRRDRPILSFLRDPHRRDRTLKMLRIVFGNGARDVPTITGLTPLRIAVEKGHLNVVKRLLSAGANVNAPVTRPGMTALEVAAAMGHSQIVRKLLDAGANVNLTVGDKTYMSALQFAGQIGHISIVKMLIAAGALIPACPPYDDSRAALAIAIEDRDIVTISKILKPEKIKYSSVFCKMIEAHHEGALKEAEKQLRLCEMLAKKRYENGVPVEWRKSYELWGRAFQRVMDQLKYERTSLYSRAAAYH